MATPGDSSTAPIERLGTTGVFTSTLREALLRGDVDLVVHSGKDLPTAPVPGLQIAAFPAREDPRDALIWPSGTSLDTLPRGARIGTGSPRRAALLRATGRQPQIVPMRGNVGTRLRKLAEGEADALVLAMAGLSRLGMLDSVASPLDPSVLMPAPAQGCWPSSAAATIQRRQPSSRPSITHPPEPLRPPNAASSPGSAPAAVCPPARSRCRLSALEANRRFACPGVIAAADGSAVIRGRVTGPAGDPLGRHWPACCSSTAVRPCWTGPLRPDHLAARAGRSSGTCDADSPSRA